MASKSDLSVVIDIGTSKMVALAGKLTEQGSLEILGISKVESKGIKRGIIFNIDEAAETVNTLLEKLEEQFDEEIDVVHVALAGQKMQTLNYKTSTPTSGEGFVTEQDVDRIYDEAKNVELQEGYEVVRVIPTSFKVDDEVVQNPVGTTGLKIEAEYKLVVAATSYLNSLKLVFGKLGIELGEVIHSSLAISEVIANREEKEVGVVVLDFGAGTTKLAVFQENVLVHTAVIPFGGDVVTNDIKEGCSIFMKKAELLKVKYGEAMGDFADEQKMVTIAGENGWEPRDISFKSLAYIIQARLEEIIECVFTQIQKSGVTESMGSGIVVTGGTSKLENIVSLIKYKTAMDARKGHAVVFPVNRKKEFQDADLLTALGAMKLVLANSQSNGTTRVARGGKKASRFAPLFKGVVQGALNLFDVDNSDLELN